jgi:hypothetical protein
VDGRTLHVRLWSRFGSNWYSHDCTYVAYSPTPAAMASPSPGGTLAGATQTFTWTGAEGANLYQVWVGTSVGGYQLGVFPPGGTTGTSTTASGLPVDGRMLYVRLWTRFGSTWVFTDASYTASTATPATMISPGSGTTLQGATQTFTWSNAHGDLYQVWVGTSPGSYNFGSFPAGGTTGTSTTASGLPVDGRMLYVRLWTRFGSTWVFTDATYRAFAP